jgi:hypothetical protein
MRIAVLGGLMLSGLGLAAVAVLAAPGGARADRGYPAQDTAQGGLLTHSLALGDSRQQLTVVDPVRQVICVYHIESSTGEISLKSTRSIHWDLQLPEFNTASPLPREIRAMHQK